MTKSIFKPLLAGVVLGVMAYFIPKFLFGLLILLLIMKCFKSCCGSRGCCGGRHHGLEMMDKIRAMSDAEYAEFVAEKTKSCCGGSKPSCKSTC